MIALTVITLVAIYFVFLRTPGECHECGKRFEEKDTRHRSKRNKHLCRQCYVIEHL